MTQADSERGGSHEVRAEEELTQFMLEWSAAIVTNDVARIEAFTTHDWVLIDGPGAITRESFHLAVGGGLLQHHTMEHDVLAVTLREGFAVVRTHGRNTATFDGEGIEADEWTTNILLDDGDQWRCMLTQLTPRTVRAE